MSDALGLVAGALREAGIEQAGPPFARYFSTSAEGLDVAAGFPVAEPFLGDRIVHPGELPAGPAAVATHVGPYDGLEAAWAAVRAGGSTSSGEPRGEDPWEVYFIGPGQRGRRGGVAHRAGLAAGARGDGRGRPRARSGGRGGGGVGPARYRSGRARVASLASAVPRRRRAPSPPAWPARPRSPAASRVATSSAA